MLTQYVASIFKGRRGHGLLSVHASSRKKAIETADRIAKGKGCRCFHAESRRAFQRKMATTAVSELIWRNTKIL